MKWLISYIVILVKLYRNNYHWFVDNLQELTLVILSNIDMLMAHGRSNAENSFRLYYLGINVYIQAPPTVVKNVTFVCTTIGQFSTADLTGIHTTEKWKAALMWITYVLLVRRHLKYTWFTKFTKFWGKVKNGPSLGISKNKKAFSCRGGLYLLLACL